MEEMEEMKGQRVQNRVVVILYRKKIREKKFLKKLKVAGTKSHQKSVMCLDL